MTNTPIDVFREWYLKQPDEVRETAAIMILSKAPRFDTGGFRAVLEPLETLADYLSKIPERSSQIIGEILFIRAVVDFSVVRQYGSAEDWEQKKDLDLAVADEIDAEHGPNEMTKRLRSMVEAFPKRQAMWLESAKSWRALRNSGLSDEVLEAWQRDNPTRL